MGGEVSEGYFTHLIATKLSRSGKFFTALAAGKYVLHSDYVKKSVKAKEWLGCDKFEFGNPNFSLQVDSNEELKMAPYRCRLLVANNSQKYRLGIFTDMAFIIIAKDKRRNEFNSVIQSGGGTILEQTSDFDASVLKRKVGTAGYCLVENATMLNEKDLTTLKKCNFRIETLKFIFEHILRVSLNN